MWYLEISIGIWNLRLLAFWFGVDIRLAGGIVYLNDTFRFLSLLLRRLPRDIYVLVEWHRIWIVPAPTRRIEDRRCNED